jgi:hypothetical protein
MKQWFSFYFPKYGDLCEILDAAKVNQGEISSLMAILTAESR